ncbi:MAG: phosphatase PAP2 family protein [Kiritimatiellia bacterium]
MTASPAPAPKVHDARNATSVRHGASYYWRLWLPDIAVLLVLMAVTQWFFHDGTRDIAWMRPLFTPGSGEGWTQHHALFWAWLKDALAPVPAVAVVVASVWVLWRGVRHPRWARWRVYALFVLFALSLGPGLVVNGVLKQSWGRPRPRQVEAFGGVLQQRGPWERSPTIQCRSFPCGHSSVGYYLRRRRRWIGALALAAALTYGTVVGYGRMLAGAHFPSDVLWSAWLVLLVNWILYYFVFNLPGREDARACGAAPPVGRAGSWRIWLGACLGIGALGGVMLGMPVYDEFAYRWPAADNLAVTFENANLTVHLDESDNQVRISGIGRGFGVPGSGVRCRVTRTRADAIGSDGCLALRLKRIGLATDLDVDAHLWIPVKGRRSLRILGQQGQVRIVAENPPSETVRIELASGQVILPPAWKNKPGIEVVVPPGALKQE